jgi:uncharacterized protein YjbI with pentapeptide repeats
MPIFAGDAGKVRAVGELLGRRECERCQLRRLGPVRGQFEGIDWNSASFTDCDLTNSELGELDLRSTNLRGATLDVQQVALLMKRIGITVVP